MNDSINTDDGYGGVARETGQRTYHEVELSAIDEVYASGVPHETNWSRFGRMRMCSGMCEATALELAELAKSLKRSNPNISKAVAAIAGDLLDVKDVLDVELSE